MSQIDARPSWPSKPEEAVMKKTWLTLTLTFVLAPLVAAAPATAWEHDFKEAPAASPRVMRIWAFAPFDGIEWDVPTGTWQALRIGWAAISPELLQEYVIGTTTTISVDGEVVPYETVYESFTDPDFGTVYSVLYIAMHPPLSSGPHDQHLEIRFEKPVDDGVFPTVPAGTVWSTDQTLTGVDAASLR
jgi:hypothetical protein